MNEKDLSEQGININPSELDFLLPVINPTKLPPDQTQTMKPLQALSSLNIQHMMSTERTLNNVKDILETASSSQMNNPKLLARISSSQKEKQLKSNERPNDLFSTSNSKIKNSTQAKINLKQALVRNAKINTTKSSKVHPKQAYYNIYDVDKPVTIKRVQKHEEPLSKDKQEILNNTLAVYGLRLDPKGKNVILKDIEKHSGSIGSKNGKGREELKEHKGINEMTTIKATGKKSGKQFKMKNVDTIKSLWSILQNVSKKWK